MTGGPSTVERVTGEDADRLRAPHVLGRACELGRTGIVAEVGEPGGFVPVRRAAVRRLDVAAGTSSR